VGSSKYRAGDRAVPGSTGGEQRTGSALHRVDTIQQRLTIGNRREAKMELAALTTAQKNLQQPHGWGRALAVLERRGMARV